MPVLTQFSTPARQSDFPNDPGSQQQLNDLWSTHVAGFTAQAIQGNPWNETNASDQTAYYDPLVTDIPQGTASALVSWNATPKRIVQYTAPDQHPENGYDYSQEAQWELADTGSMTVAPGIRHPLPPIPADLCPQPDWNGPMRPYGPYGPRGWQDEYCEWSVARNSAGKITRVDIVCENPEYWYTFWRVDPDAVAAAYEAALNFGAAPGTEVTVSAGDLVLEDPWTGDSVIDPSTGRPAYNPLNKWNSGTISQRGGASPSGGAMHLTATPNTLQTELQLAGGATIQRSVNGQNPASNEEALICCAQYGQNYRHSDPHIGQSVNQLVGSGYIVSLADPVGLYIQEPDFSSYALPQGVSLPPGAKPSDCWTVARGTATLEDPVTGGNFPGNFILHAVFQIPSSWLESNPGLTVSDLAIDGTPIAWGAQIIETMNIGLFPRPIASSTPAAQPCVGTPGDVLCQPLQLFYESLWDAYAGTSITNPVGFPELLAANTVVVPPEISQGTSGMRMALVCNGALTGSLGELPTVAFPPPQGGTDDVQVEVVDLVGPVVYAVPGNSYPSPNQVLVIEVSVDADAQTGVRSVRVDNPGLIPGIPAAAFLNVVS